MQAEGIELGFSFGFDVGMGDLTFSGTANKYLTHEFQSLAALPVVDCNGYFGTSCENARPDFRMIERTTWNLNNLSLSMQLRHVGAVLMEPPECCGHASRVPQHRCRDLRRPVRELHVRGQVPRELRRDERDRYRSAGGRQRGRLDELQLGQHVPELVRRARPRVHGTAQHNILIQSFSAMDGGLQPAVLVLMVH